MVQCFRLNFIQLMAVGIRRHRHDLKTQQGDLDRAKIPSELNQSPPILQQQIHPPLRCAKYWEASAAPADAGVAPDPSDSSGNPAPP
jgi:hypothetical protein